MTGLGEWDDDPAADDPADSPDPAGQGSIDEPPALYYPNLDAFVREQVIPVFRRKVGTRAGSARWAADWWRYPEAVLRLDGMWRAWEHLRHDPALGISTWLRDHADPHLAVLLSEDGPFARATEEATVDEPLPYEPPPRGLFR